MKICIPTQEDKGIDGLVFGHFGSASYFLIYNTESNEIKTVSNKNRHHSHGTCQPMSTLNGEKVDAFVVGGIGKRAVLRLNDMGVKVYQSIERTAQKNIEKLKVGNLVELTPQNACSHHGHGPGGCCD